MIQRLPFQFPGTADDVARLSGRLRQAFSVIGFPQVTRLAVLNLACGRADETGALAAALAPAQIGAYLGIDLRPYAIAEAARRWTLPGGIIEFRCGDAAAIDRLVSQVDLIFIRHQNYWDDPSVWDRLLENALKALKPDGLLVCTSYFDREHELLLAALKTRGAEVLWNVRSPDCRSLPDAPGKSVDRHLVLFSRESLGKIRTTF
ncbi:MAG: class I SAM-dependent methyltransferase [Luteolibacter sp.]